MTQEESMLEEHMREEQKRVDMEKYFEEQYYKEKSTMTQLQNPLKMNLTKEQIEAIEQVYSVEIFNFDDYTAQDQLIEFFKHILGVIINNPDLLDKLGLQVIPQKSVEIPQDSTKSNWIKIEEGCEMPDGSTDVLLWRHNGVIEGYYDVGDHKWYSYQQNEIVPIAWQPLPNPPNN